MAVVAKQTVDSGADGKKWVVYVGTAADIRINLSGTPQYKRFVKSEPVEVPMGVAITLGKRDPLDFVVSDTMPTHVVKKIPLVVRRQVAAAPIATQEQLSAAA